MSSVVHEKLTPSELHYYCRYFVRGYGTYHDYDELLDSLYLYMWEYQETRFDGSVKPNTFLYRRAKGFVTDYFRSIYRKIPKKYDRVATYVKDLEEYEIVIDIVEDFDFVDDVITKIDLEDNLKTLSDRNRKMFELKINLGLNNQEIAHIFGITESRVSQILTKNVKKWYPCPKSNSSSLNSAQLDLLAERYRAS